MNWIRIDNRLVHGQVIETWVPHLGAKSILVVNDELADDELRQEIMRLAIPGGIELLFTRVEQLSAFLDKSGQMSAHGTKKLRYETRKLTQRLSP